MEKLVARFANRRFLTDEVNSRGHKMKMTLVRQPVICDGRVNRPARAGRVL